MTDNEPLVGEPTFTGDRGFFLYGGRPIPTTRGQDIRVVESSAASGPHVWLFNEPEGSAAPHLSLAQAMALRAALDQFIESVPERWENGQEKLDEARRIAFGEAIDIKENRMSAGPGQCHNPAPHPGHDWQSGDGKVYSCGGVQAPPPPPPPPAPKK